MSKRPLVQIGLRVRLCRDMSWPSGRLGAGTRGVLQQKTINTGVGDRTILVFAPIRSRKLKHDYGFGIGQKLGEPLPDWLEPIERLTARRRAVSKY